MRLNHRIRTFESLAIRDFRLLWAGQVTTSLGQWMDQTARSWLIFDITHSPLQLGFISAARGIPMLIFAIAAGVAADRWGRKPQLIIAQVVNAILNAVLATLVITGNIQVWHIYVTAVLAGTVQAFQQPARQALINDLVGEKHLMNAIALNSAAVNTSRSIGPAICGVLIHFLGVDISYYVQAAMYAFATVWTVQIRAPEIHFSPAENGAARPSFLSSAQEGFSFLGTKKIILSLMILGLAPIFLGAPFTSLMPLFAIDVLHGNSVTQGWLLATFGIGAVVGALVLASLGRRQGNGNIMVVGAIGFGASLVFFALSPVLGISVAATFLAGVCNSSYTSQAQSIIQMLTPAKLRGRVMGIYFLNRGLMPLGSMVMGTLAATLGGPLAVTIMGAACVIVAFSITLIVPELWKLRASREYPVSD